MPESDARLHAAIAAIDDLNAEDPTKVTLQGVTFPKELLHAQRVTYWLLRLDPEADALQQVAARAHHLRRWVVPRATYPAGRAGYLRWRRDQKLRHAEEVAGLLEDLGWSSADIASVQEIVRKDALGADTADARVQHHEDALCLTFVEMQLAEVLATMGEERTIALLRKTLGKMSAGAAELAVAAAPDAASAAVLRVARRPT